MCAMILRFPAAAALFCGAIVSASMFEGFTGSFFDINAWSSTSPCYSEFFIEENKQAWSECCEKNRWSQNCVNYNPADVCYDEMEVGEDAVVSGPRPPYLDTDDWNRGVSSTSEPTDDSWYKCCHQYCVSWNCETIYCQSGESYAEEFMIEWGWAVYLSAAGCILVIIGLCLCIGCCCMSCCRCGICSDCCCCGSKKKRSRADHLEAGVLPGDLVVVNEGNHVENRIAVDMGGVGVAGAPPQPSSANREKPVNILVQHRIEVDGKAADEVKKVEEGYAMEDDLSSSCVHIEIE